MHFFLLCRAQRPMPRPINGLVDRHGFYQPDAAAAARAEGLAELKAQAVEAQRKIDARLAAKAAEEKRVKHAACEERRAAKAAAWHAQLVEWREQGAARPRKGPSRAPSNSFRRRPNL